MQINSLFPNVLDMGKTSAGQAATPEEQLEEVASEFESMLADRAQSKQEKPAPKKEEAKPADKPQQADKAQEAQPQEPTKEGMEVAAGLVTTQPVVLFDVIDASGEGQAVQVVDPMAAMQQPAPVLQEAAAPVVEEALPVQPEQPEIQVEGAAMAEASFQEEAQQAPVGEEQPEVPQAEVEVEHQPEAQAVAQERKAPQAEAVGEEQPEEAEVKDVEVEAQPVFRRETPAPVKVGESYEPVAPEEPEAPQQLADRLVQMLEQGDTKVELMLNPENLGRMTVEITRTHEGVLHIVLGAVNQKAVSLLQENSASLHSLLAASQDGEVRIEVQQQEPQQQPNQFMNPDEQGRQQHQQQQKPRQQAATEDFVQQLRLGLVEKEPV